MKNKTAQKQQNKPRDPEELGKMLIGIYESGYLDRPTAYRTSFFKGILAGLGGAVGATIVLALVLWVLGLFSSVPLLGRVVENIKDTVNSANL